MTRPTRRAFLGLAGAAAAGLAGCTELIGAGSPTPTPAGTADGTATDSPEDSQSETPTGTGGRLTLEPTGAPEGDAAVAVPQRDLREWLREAALTGDTLRKSTISPIVMPRPALLGFDRMRLTSPEGEVDGRYDVQVEGGTRYEYLVGAEEATPPDDATVTPVSELPPERGNFARQAIGSRARVYPETRLGEWVREEWFGGYYRYDGTTYRGREIQQTDAAFFSHELWYVFSLRPTDGGDSMPVVRLGDLDDEVRDVVDELLGDRERREGIEREFDRVPEAVARFAGGTDYLLTHAAVLSVRLETAG